MLCFLITASKTVISNLLDFIDNCAIDDYLLMVSNHYFSDGEVTNIDVLLDKIRAHEGKLRRFRQQIEYKVRRGRVEQLRKR